MQGLVRIAASLLFGLTLSGCLANDPRPPAGSVLVTATGDPAIRDGFTSVDGWDVSFDRVLVSLGRASAEDDEGTCNNSYSDPDYTRVLDMTVPGAQKVNLVYALGKCSIDLELSSPWDDSVLGKTVSAADRDFMRTPGSDAYVTDGGVSIFVVATAHKGGKQKHLSWPWRFRIDYTNVGTKAGDQVMRGVDLQEHEALTLDIPIRGEVLFRDHLSETGAELTFDAIARADDDFGDADGEVSLAELGQVPLGDVATTTRYADGVAKGSLTLGDYIYKGLFKGVVDANAKELDVLPNDRNPH